MLVRCNVNVKFDDWTEEELALLPTMSKAERAKQEEKEEEKCIA